MQGRHVCPRCGWSYTRPSAHAGFLDTIAAAFAFKPFRCRKCRTRFFRFTGGARTRVGVWSIVIILVVGLAIAIIRNAPAQSHAIQQDSTDLLPR
jgi:hypothetical protein